MATSHQYIVCYDIADPKRLKRIHKCVLAYAMSIHYSVYFAVLSKREHKTLVAELSNIICHDEDDVRIYKISDIEAALFIGGNLVQQYITDQSVFIVEGNKQ